MIRFSYGASKLRLQAATLSVLVAGLVLVSSARAVNLDFTVASGNYDSSLDPGPPHTNWIDPNGVTYTVPTVADTAYVRNNGTVTISSNVAALEMRIGDVLAITPGDYDDSGIVGAGDYVLWRKGGPLANDLTPGVQAADYTTWRSQFENNLDQQFGMPGTLNWTDGEITGPFQPGGNPLAGGPSIRVGRIQLLNNVLPVYEVPGTVVQNGPMTKLLLPFTDSRLRIGDASTATGSFVNASNSSYTLVDGTIGLAVGSTASGTNGTDGNRGIYVRNGTFTMTGGNIIDATPDQFLATPNAQRFLTVGDHAGGGAGNEAVSTANLSGGTINVLGGIRAGLQNHTKGIVNISGTVNIVTGGDTSIGYQPNTNGVNGTGEMNMSGGTFQVGRTDDNPYWLRPENGGLHVPLALSGRLVIGDRGKGTLNMSGGTINVTRNVVVGNEAAFDALGVPKTIGSVINLTGGTITTGGLEMRRSTPLDAIDPNPNAPFAASIIVDGPTAAFTTTGLGSSPLTIIGGYGKALFEVRQGTAVLGGGGATINVGTSPSSQAVINVTGGKLTLGGPVTRTVTPTVAPVFGLTGGTLEWNNTTTTAAQTFSADLNNQATTLVTKANEQLQVIPNNFAMSGGAWNIDIKNIGLVGGLHNVLSADWFNANTASGTASLTGGTLNINFMAGFTPIAGDKFRILRGGNGVTLNAANVTITGAAAGFWSLQTAAIGTLSANDAEIQLWYTGPGSGSGGGLGGSMVPEPSSAALVVFAVVGLLTRRGARTRTSA